MLAELNQSRENMSTSPSNFQDDKEFQDAIRMAKAEALGGLRALDTFTAERFELRSENQSAFEAAIAFEAKTDNMYISGTTGTGKSHLAAIAARRLMRGRIITTTQMKVSRQARFNAPTSEDEIIQDLSKVPVLVIDDLGVGKDTEFSLSLIYEILQGRYMRRPGGLIITSNLTLDQIASKLGDDRISSRIAQMCKGKIFHIAGKDMRLGGN